MSVRSRDVESTGVMPVMTLVVPDAVRTHPHPMRVIHDTALSVASPMAQPAAAWPSRRDSGAVGPGQFQARNSTARSAGAFTLPARAQSTIPGTMALRRATARPARSRPNMRASLCAPPTRVVSTRGEPEAQHHGRGSVSPGRSGQHRDGPQGHGQSGHGQQAQQHQVDQDLVAGEVGGEPVEPEECRPVGRWRVGPERAGQGAERRDPEDAGAVEIGADAVSHHLALAGVAIEVPAEEGRGQGQGHGPRPDHSGHHAHRHPGIRTAHPQQDQPGPGQQDDAAVDPDQGQHGRLTRGCSVACAGGRAEEPSPGQRRDEDPATRQGAADDGHGGHHAQDQRPAQRGVASRSLGNRPAVPPAAGRARSSQIGDVKRQNGHR